MKNTIPKSVAAALWSYDLKQLNLQNDAQKIITNILNYGSLPAIEWLFSIYPRSKIVEVIKNPRPGEWNDKSLNFWSTVFNVTPKETTRF